MNNASMWKQWYFFQEKKFNWIRIREKLQKFEIGCLKTRFLMEKSLKQIKIGKKPGMLIKKLKDLKLK